MTKLDITYLGLNTLKYNPRNSRTHSKQQIRQIAKSISEFGFAAPVLVDEQGLILAGHGRVAAAKLLGLDSIPTVRLDHMTAAQKRAFIIADNRLAELAGWDQQILALELQELSALELDFEVELTGFATAEIDLLIAASQEDSNADADINAEEVSPTVRSDQPPISQVGDLWLLGQHRLLCGDALKEANYERLMDNEGARMIFTDPPYNVPIVGHVSGKGKHCHNDFAMACGEMTSEQFSAFLKTSLGHAARHSRDGAIHFVCMDWRHLAELLAAGKAVYNELKNVCVWVKANGGMGSLYRSRHELIFVFKTGTAKHQNNVELGRFGRNRSNVWEYPGMNSLGAEDRDLLAIHPTVKPLALVADAILDCSRRGDIVLDPFLGSGTTIVAAEKTGRRCFGMELDPVYVDAAIRRWQTWSGETALHAETLHQFDDLTECRRLEPASKSPCKADRGGDGHDG